MGFKCGTVPPGFNYGELETHKRVEGAASGPTFRRGVGSGAGTSWPIPGGVGLPGEAARPPTSGRRGTREVRGFRGGQLAHPPAQVAGRARCPREGHGPPALHGLLWAVTVPPHLPASPCLGGG